MTCRSFPYAASTIGVIFFNPAWISSWARSMSYCACRPIQNAGVVRNALASLSGERGLPIDQPLDAGAWHADYAGDGIGRKLHRHEKLLAQHFTRMDGRKLSSIPPGLKPIQPGERHQSASLHRVRFLVLQPDRSEDVARSFEDVWVDAPLPQCRSQLFFCLP